MLNDNPSHIMNTIDKVNDNPFKGVVIDHNPFNSTEGREWLMSLLRDGPVRVEFTKKDGTNRVMNCTLREDVAVPHQNTTDRTKEPNPQIVPVWDIDANAWRSFRLDTILNVTFNTVNP